MAAARAKRVERATGDMLSAGAKGAVEGEDRERRREGREEGERVDGQHSHGHGPYILPASGSHSANSRAPHDGRIFPVFGGTHGPLFTCSLPRLLSSLRHPERSCSIPPKHKTTALDQHARPHHLRRFPSTLPLAHNVPRSSTMCSCVSSSTPRSSPSSVAC